MRIAVLGDIALIGKYDLTKNPEAKSRLLYVKNLLSKYDYVVANLEAPLTNRSKTRICKSVHLKTATVNVQLLKFLGINVVSIANNHICDFGIDGLRDTISILEENNIDWCGYNCKDLLIDKDGCIVSISAFCCLSTNGVNLGVKKNKVNLLCKKAIEQQLEKDNVNGASSIMLIHWGEEHTHYPLSSTIEIAHSIFKKKSNVYICGSHPHCLQGTETFNEGFVVYSLGNFLFDDIYSLNGKFCVKNSDDNKRTCLLSLTFNNSKLENKELIFLYDDNDGIKRIDFKKEYNFYSRRIINYQKPEYQTAREKEIESSRKLKFCKRNFKWLLSRLNYYSIGSKILSVLNRKKYTKIQREFKK